MSLSSRAAHWRRLTTKVERRPGRAGWTPHPTKVKYHLPVKESRAMPSTPRVLIFGSEQQDRDIYTADLYLRTDGRSQFSSDLGIPMPRSGSITALSACWWIQSYGATPGTIIAEVLVNDVSVLTVSVSVTSNGTFKASTTQAEGVDTFSAGDVISFRQSAGFSGVRYKARPIFFAEVTFDS